MRNRTNAICGPIWTLCAGMDFGTGHYFAAGLSLVLATLYIVFNFQMAAEKDKESNENR